MEPSQIRRELFREAEKVSVTVQEPMVGHFILKGALEVHYYPFSKKRTAFVAGTVKGLSGCTTKEALKMTQKPPKVAEQVRKRPCFRKHKLKLFRRSPHCHWCSRRVFIPTPEVPLKDLDLEATVDHVIPRARQGSDLITNLVLACKACNMKRGHEMPEIQGI